MTKVRCDMSVSLDGFITGPEAQNPPYLDAGFFRVTSWLTLLATWREHRGMEGGTRNADDDLFAEMFEQAGAYVMGRRMFDSGEEPWGDEPPFRAPVFVVTHREREPLERKGERPSTSSPTACRPPSSGPRRLPVTATSPSPAAPGSCSRSSPPAC
jgi:dihydrofolate reductase